MAQTRRKRRTKHRGNAAGMIEARGRTGRKPSSEELAGKGGAKAARGRGALRPPTWRSAAAKAAFGGVMLFVFVQLGVLGKSSSVSQALLLCVFAIALYTPIMYATDKFIYQRKLRQLQRGKD